MDLKTLSEKIRAGKRNEVTSEEIREAIRSATADFRAKVLAKKTKNENK